VLGETIGNFKVIQRVGTGGMGEVWLAEQQSIGTHVAIKLMNDTVSQDAEHVQRFFNEARAVSRIQHAGIVKIFDVGMHAGRAYLIMEYLEGETLSQRLKKRGKLPFSQIGDIGRQIATVLDATHSAGITHRDLKPDNIFLVPDRELGERVKILDFGIAKLSGTLAAASPRTLGTMGTPAYMAPEQWGDTSKVDWRADLYSLGCVAFEMTCGRVPFEASNIAEACGKHLNEPPPKASSLAPTVPASLERLIAQLLAKDPAARPASMLEVARAFASVDKEAIGSAPTLTTDPVSLPLHDRKDGRDGAKKSPLIPILLGLLVLGGGAAAAVYLLQPDATSVSGDAASTATAPTAEPAKEPEREIAAPPPPPPPRAPDQPQPSAQLPPAPDAAVAQIAPDAATPAKDAGAAAKDAGVAAKDAGAKDAAAPKPKPEATPPPAESEGGADADTLVQAVRAKSAQTNQCYENALKEDPSLSGMVTLQLKIDANGRVASATADGMTDGLQACLIAQVRAIKFPKPADPPVSLIVPFRFVKE
jgi:serine/threonine protein kinase